MDWRALVQPLVRAGLIVEADVNVKHAAEVGFADEQQVVEALLADRADPALGDRIGIGARYGVRMLSTPSLWRTASKAGTNVLSRSWSR